MSATQTLCAVVAAAGVAAFLTAWPSQVGAQQIRIGPADIGGIVTGANGSEAGVWVIAETTGLGTTRYAKIVVTDEQGRYLLPALASGAQYNVWIRGVGLVDSPCVQAKSGTMLDLTAVVAPTARAAAHYCSGSYWWSMLKIPEELMFPGTGPTGNGMPTTMVSQANWVNAVKQSGCGNCHQAGDAIMQSLDYRGPWGGRRGYPDRLGVATAAGTVRQWHDQRGQQPDDERWRTLGQAGRLDRPDRCRRSAREETGPTSGHRAKYRGDPMVCCSTLVLTF